MLVSRVRAPRVGAISSRNVACDDDCECPDQPNPWLVAIGSAGIAVAAEVLVEWLKSRFVPDEERPQIHYHIQGQEFEIEEEDQEPEEAPPPKRRSRN